MSLREIWQRHHETVERYGTVAVGVVVGLFVVEMAVLITLIRLGFDLTPWLAWVGELLGVDATGLLDTAGTFGVAYAITRLLKPFQLVLAAVLTPPIAMWLGHEDGDDAEVPALSEPSMERESPPA